MSSIPKNINAFTFFKEIFRSNFMFELIEERGEVFNLNLKPIGYFHFFANPSFVKHVMFDNKENYIKPPMFTKPFWDLVQEFGLPHTNDYKIWREDRTALKNYFDQASVKNFTAIFANNTQKWLAGLEEYMIQKKAINIGDFVSQLDIINFIDTLFGGARVDSSQIRKATDDFIDALTPDFETTLQFAGIPTLKGFRIKKIKTKIYTLADELIKQCLDSNNQNLIKILAEAYRHLNIDPKLIHKRLQGETIIFIIAGYPTTTTLSIWLLMYLSLYPKMADMISEEVIAICGNQSPTADHIEKLVFTRAAIQETLRMQPSVPFTSLQAIGDDAIGLHKIKKGDIIYIPIYHMQRLPQYWLNPAGFDPTRFLSPLSEQYKYIYMPFIAGPRACLGQHFAILETTVFIAMIAQRYRFSLTSISSLEIVKSIVNRLNKNVTMTVSLR